MADSGKRIEPLIASGFHIEWESDSQSVKELDGIEMESDVAELVQATKDGKQVQVKSRGAMDLKMGKLTVKYAAFKGDKLMKWRQDVIEGGMTKARKDLTVTAYTVDNKASMKWKFLNCWPSKYSWSGLNSTSNEPIVATVVFDHEGMSLEK